MTQAEYDAIKKQGSGQAFCETCKAVTDFTHNENGAVLCVSCGNEPEVKEQR